jgi:transcriptional regulator NrdR family protein
MKQRVIKQKKHTEQYQRHKLHASIHAACLSVCELTGSAELTAETVCDHFEVWLNTKFEITSSDIRVTAAQILQQYNPSAAFMYERHLDIN